MQLRQRKLDGLETNGSELPLLQELSNSSTILQTWVVKKFGFKRRWLRSIRNTGLTVATIYLILPLWFYFCPWIRRQCVFLNNFHWPPFETKNLSEPQFFNMINTRNFYMKSEPEIELGVWHVFPKSLAHKKADMIEPKEEFKDNRPVILYFHGNSMNRAALYRRKLYNLLSDSPVDAHVVSCDYRGFGDSTNAKPSVKALVRDAEAVYNWLTERVPRSRIIVWGHSLGSGVSVQLAAKLSKENSPAGIVLESPFTNIPEATYSFPLSFFHRQMPFFDQLFSQPTKHSDTNFNSDEKIMLAKVPLLILHAEDDGMVSVKMGRKLRDIAQKKQDESITRVQYEEFEASNGCGHLFISKSSKLPKIVISFIKRVTSY